MVALHCSLISPATGARASSCRSDWSSTPSETCTSVLSTLMSTFWTLMPKIGEPLREVIVCFTEADAVSAVAASGRSRLPAICTPSLNVATTRVALRPLMNGSGIWRAASAGIGCVAKSPRQRERRAGGLDGLDHPRGDVALHALVLDAFEHAADALLGADDRARVREERETDVADRVDVAARVLRGHERAPPLVGVCDAATCLILALSKRPMTIAATSMPWYE